MPRAACELLCFSEVAGHRFCYVNKRVGIVTSIIVNILSDLPVFTGPKFVNMLSQGVKSPLAAIGAGHLQTLLMLSKVPTWIMT